MEDSGDQFAGVGKAMGASDHVAGGGNMMVASLCKSGEHMAGLMFAKRHLAYTTGLGE